MNQDDVLVSSLQRFWEVQSIRIIKPAPVPSKASPFLPSLSLENRQYEVGLPWKKTQCVVPDHLI